MSDTGRPGAYGDQSQLSPKADHAWDRFESAWVADESPRIEEYVDGFDGAERKALLYELLSSEVGRRIGRGENPPINEYLARFPEDADIVRGAFQESGAASEPDTGGADAVADGTIRYVGDYELHNEIARGGRGIVYKARQVSLNRPVAVKLLLDQTRSDWASTQRFNLEVKAAANIEHPNIVPIYEVGEHEGRPYYSMKLFERGTLKQRIAEDREAGREAEPIACARLMATAAAAVHSAHQRAILHRDLKPSNILLDKDGAPHIADFGEAKLLGDDSGLTWTGELIGTPVYMSPEQANGRKDITTATDVYSLGAILYELLSGPGFTHHFSRGFQ
jgi:eukaryotic-like serine/threonine-protein kinase